MSRVLLVNPPPHQRVDQYDTPDFTRMGLACLASWLRLDPSVTVAIVDAKFERLTMDAVMDRVRAFRPDVVGLTAMTNEILPAARVAAAVKRWAPSVVTVVGGPHPTALPERTLDELPAFDAVVVGEGEQTFAALVGALARGEAGGELPGVRVRSGGEPRQCSSPPLPPLDFPLPAWDLLPGGRRFLVMTQRGCPYACSFCANPNGRAVRSRSTESVIAELEWIVGEWGPDELTLCDEIFTVDRARTHRLLDAIIASGLHRRVRWWAQTHVNCVDQELFAKMKAAGCHRCALGIETGDAAAMKAMRKGITRDRVMAARRMARQAGLPVEGLFILGHPGETRESAQRTIDFAVELDPEIPIFSTMVPYPGTRIGDMALRGESGYRLLSADWNEWLNQIGGALELEHLSRRDIEALQLQGYVKVFTANGRYGDLARFAWRYRSEGWAVARKLLTGRGPRPVDPGA